MSLPSEGKGYKYTAVFQHLVQSINTSTHIFQHCNPLQSNQLSNQTFTTTTTSIKMQFTTFTIAAFAALTSAAAVRRAPIDLCPALDTPQCCQVDVDGVIDLTCEARKSEPISIVLAPEFFPTNTIPTAESDLTTVADFEASCATSGTTAMCCTLPVVCFRRLYQFILDDRC